MSTQRILTVPNLLSLLRLALIPVYILQYQAGEFRLAGGILIVSCLTDWADGFLARKYDLVSTLGIVLDPVADKATQLALVYCLSSRYAVLRPMLYLLVVKEAFQLIAGVVSLKAQKMLSGALPAGKVSTAVLFVSLTALVLFPELPMVAVNLVAALDILALSVSFWAYLRVYASLLRK